jgi:hypothetical protein
MPQISVLLNLVFLVMRGIISFVEFLNLNLHPFINQININNFLLS